MNTIQLTNALATNPVTKHFFGGVCAADEIKYHPEKFIIVNNQSSDEPGQHWLAVYFGEIPEFFDSLGHPPAYYRDAKFQEFLIVNGPRYRYNTQRLQKRGTSSCGLFCIYYVFFKCLGYKMSDIINSFSSNLTTNEDIVNKWFVDVFNRL